MEYLPLKLLIASAVALIGLYAVISFEFKYPELKGNLVVRVLNEFFGGVMLLCAAGFVITVAWDYFTQPSSEEICMGKADTSWDDEAISWMEDYCSK